MTSAKPSQSGDGKFPSCKRQLATFERVGLVCWTVAQLGRRQSRCGRTTPLHETNVRKLGKATTDLISVERVLIEWVLVHRNLIHHHPNGPRPLSAHRHSTAALCAVHVGYSLHRDVRDENIGCAAVRTYSVGDAKATANMQKRARAKHGPSQRASPQVHGGPGCRPVENPSAWCTASHLSASSPSRSLSAPHGLQRMRRLFRADADHHMWRRKAAMRKRGACLVQQNEINEINARA